MARDKVSRAAYMRSYRAGRKRNQHAPEPAPVVTTVTHVNTNTGVVTPVATGLVPPVSILADPDIPRKTAVVQPDRLCRVAEGDVTAPVTRRRFMKSDKEIRSFIINAMQQQGQNPQGLLNVLCGYVNRLQDDMKRDSEADMADRVCEHAHPGVMPAGVFCRTCHDAQMANKFGAIQGQAPLVELEDEEVALMNVKLSAPTSVKE